jgi:hypothetical protein
VPRIAVVLLTFGIVYAPAWAAADPIHINAGALVGDSFAARMIASSPDQGFSVDAFGDAAGGIYEPVQLCNFSEACAPGAIVGLEAMWSGGDFTGGATVDGITYDLGGFDSASVLADFTGTWTAPPFSGGTTATARAPFAFSGLFFYPSRPGFPLGSLALTGSGMATLDLHWGNFGSWNVRNTRYEFVSPNVSPEPASLLLLASGAGVLMVRRRGVRL